MMRNAHLVGVEDMHGLQRSLEIQLLDLIPLVLIKRHVVDKQPDLARKFRNPLQGSADFISRLKA